MKRYTIQGSHAWRNLIFLLLVLISPVVPAQISGWHWVNPLPQGNVLHQVLFQDQQTGYAVGGYGSILKTEDGGIQWSSIPSPTDEELSSLACPGMNELIVVGGKACFITRDDGIHWATFGNEQMDSAKFDKVIFLNADTGFISSYHGTIFKTTDGGTSWSGINVNQNGNLYPVGLVQFTDQLTGYARYMYGNFFKTTDGGSSWQIKNIGIQYDINAMRFINNDTGFVSTYAGVRMTVDGGQSWQTINPEQRITDFAFTSQTTGFAVTDMGKILKTANAGTSWTVTGSLPARFTSIAFADPGHGCIVGEAGQVFSTSDSGSTWQQRSTGYIAWLNSLSFPTPDAGYAGGHGVILKSADYGNSWIPIDTLPGCHVPWIRFFTPDHGTAIIYSETNYNAKYATTSDGGQTWQYSPLLDNSTYSEPEASIPDENTCYVAGFFNDPKEYMYRTLDNGATWQPVQVPGDPYHHYFFKVHFFSPDTGVFVDKYDNRLLFHKTVNGGLSWETSTIDTTGAFVEKIFMLNQQTGYLVRDHGFFRTSDGGNNWQTVVIPDSVNQYAFTDISFITPEIGFLVGWTWYDHYQGLILKTEDGGTTWLPQLHKTSSMLNAVVITDENTAIAAGENGTILMTNSRGDRLSAPSIPGNKILSGLSFPNPCTDYIRLKLDPVPEGNFSVEIFSMLGKIVYHQAANSSSVAGNTILIETGNLGPGLYHYRVLCGQRIISGKFIRL